MRIASLFLTLLAATSFITGINLKAEEKPDLEKQIQELKDKNLELRLRLEQCELRDRFVILRLGIYNQAYDDFLKDIKAADTPAKVKQAVTTT